MILKKEAYIPKPQPAVPRRVSQNSILRTRWTQTYMSILVFLVVVNYLGLAPQLILI